MGGSRSSAGEAPKADPNIGRAALLSAQTGEDMLEWSKQQSALPTKWAQNDRKRYTQVFRPIQNDFIKESLKYDTKSRQRKAANEAAATVSQQFDIAAETQNRQLSAMGAAPGSGRFNDASVKMRNAEALAVSGAKNTARGAVRDEGFRRMGNVVNLGEGSAINPGTSMGLGSSIGASGFQGAMNGYGQQAQILGNKYGQEMNAFNAAQQRDAESSSGLWGGLGAIGGALISNPAILTSFSSKDYKENKRPTRGALKALEKMPVEDWDYKKGIADGGRHTGPYAEDFKKATGLGDGKSIPLQDQIGVTQAAVQELAGEVKKLTKARGAVRSAA